MAGAIAIDLLPAVLVLILMVTQSAIRENRHNAPAVDGLTLGELRAAMHAMREVEAESAPRPAPAPKPDTPAS